MPRALSDDLRMRVIEAVDAGMSRRAAASLFKIAPSTAIGWVSDWHRSGRVEARPLGGDRRSHRVEIYAEEVLTLVDDVPDITLAEVAAHLEDTHGVRFSESVLWRCLDRHGMSYKKNSARQRAGTARRRRAARRLARRSA
jgi:transposase